MSAHPIGPTHPSQHWLGWLAPLLLAALFAWAGNARAQAIEPLPFQNHAEEVRFQNLTKQLRCLVCQNENLADSNAELARDLRLIVFKQMQEGHTDDQIKAYLVARYSSFVLYDPPLRPGTWLLWFGPAALLLAGAGVVLVAVKRRRKDTAVAEAPIDTGDDW